MSTTSATSAILEQAVIFHRTARNLPQRESYPTADATWPVEQVHDLFNLPINNLVRVAGTPLADQAPLDPLEFVRTVAVARITMPRARVRLSAGRQQMGDAVQALCFLAGANSIFYGDKLFTTGNPDTQADLDLLARLGLQAGQPQPFTPAR